MRGPPTTEVVLPRKYNPLLVGVSLLGRSAPALPEMVNEAVPFHCVRSGKPFGKCSLRQSNAAALFR